MALRAFCFIYFIFLCQSFKLKNTNSSKLDNNVSKARTYRSQCLTNLLAESQ